MRALQAIAGTLTLAFMATVIHDGISQWTNNKDADQLRVALDTVYDVQITPLVLNSPDNMNRDASFVSLIKKGSNDNDDRIGYSMASRTLPYVFPSDKNEASSYDNPSTLLQIHTKACALLEDYKPTHPSWYLKQSVRRELEERQFSVQALIQMYCAHSAP